MAAPHANGGASSSDGVGPATAAPVDSKLARVQGKVDEVKEQMRGNIELIMERQEKLEDIDTQTVVFNEQAKSFTKGAGRVKNKMRWQKYKWYLICLLIFCVVFSGVITVIILLVKN